LISGTLCGTGRVFTLVSMNMTADSEDGLMSLIMLAATCGTESFQQPETHLLIPLCNMSLRMTWLTQP